MNSYFEARTGLLLPPRKKIVDFTESVIRHLFPIIDGGRPVFRDETLLRLELITILESTTCYGFFTPCEAADAFFADIPSLYGDLEADAHFIESGDPAANSVEEVVIAYPGFYAIAVYRLANRLHRLGVELMPRIMTEHAHSVTGIDIHPRATIGREFCIDHGTGVVIGESTIIGNRVKIYQGVTLGALSVRKEAAETRRHPVIEDGVVIYAGATILGGDTIIGRNSIIGGNVWLTDSVPPESIVQNRQSVTVRKRNGLIG